MSKGRRKRTNSWKARKWEAAQRRKVNSPEFKAWLESSSLNVTGGVRSDGRDAVRNRKRGDLG